MTNARIQRLVLILPIVAGILFGSAGVFVRTLTAYGMDNPTVFFARTSFATLCMLVVILVRDPKMLRLKAKDVPLFIGTGVVCMTGLNLCYNEAMNELSLSFAAVLLCTAPVFVVILAAIFLGEKVTGRKIFCMVLAIVGCVLTSGFLEQLGAVTISALGVVCGIGSAVFYALYSILSRRATDAGYHTYTVVFYSVLFATIVLLPFTDLGVIGSYITDAPLADTAFLFANALCIAVLPYIAITMALQHAEAGKVSILASAVEPAAAAVFGALVYSEIPSVLMLAGMLITIAAIAFLLVAPKDKDLPAGEDSSAKEDPTAEKESLAAQDSTAEENSPADKSADTRAR